MLKFRSSKARGLEDIEPHEILLDSLANKKEEEIGVASQKLEVPLLKKILQVFFVFCFLVIVGLFLKTFHLQVVEGEAFLALAQENKFIIHQIRAERGVIYDKNLEQLVFNRSSFDLICKKNDLPGEETEKNRIIGEAAGIVNRDPEEVKEKILNSETSEILIAENISHEALILLETKIKELPGFEVENSSIREYYSGPLFSQILGYTGKINSEELKESPGVYLINDYIGRSGIEKSYESFLRKNPGQLRMERDALGNIISKEIIALPESGESLVLWLDSDLQAKIQEELEKKLQEVGTKKAVAVAMDPKTGGILSLVSLPSFDNNLFQKGADQAKLNELLEDSKKLQPLFNRAISGKYLVGSTIKPLIASGVLEEGLITPEKDIYCQGLISIPNPWVPNASTTKRDWSAHGWTDMRKAIAESCDVYFYTVGGGFQDQQGLGPTKIKEYLELFGWTAKTGIDLPGETAGFVPDKDWKKETWDQAWWDGDTYNMAIGQGFLQITPLEVTSAFSAVANGGKLYSPKVVQKVINTSSGFMETVEEIEPELIRENFISPDNLQVVREGMRQAVTGQGSPQASAVILNSLPVASAAKTGTAELGNDHYNNWITVFAPYEDPQIVLTLMIENVKGVQEAVKPVARSILEWYFTK